MEFKQIELCRWTVTVVYSTDEGMSSVEDTVPAGTADAALTSVLRKHGIPWYAVASIRTAKI